MSLYLDTSVLVPLFVAETKSDGVRRVLRLAGEQLLVSDLTAGEFAASLSRQFRVDASTADASRQRLLLFDQWMETDAIAVSVLADDVRRAASIVRRFELKLLMPDAIHAAICERLGETLLTADGRLAEAAQALGITVITPR